MKIPEQYDIAVVGGGIAGLYCCLYAPPGKRVALFEATGRIGGKVETAPLEGFQAEWGSMRFDPSRQPVIGRLIEELRLETEPFPEYSSPPVTERRTTYNLDESERNLNALELFTLGIGRILNKSEAELMAASEEELERLRRNGKHKNSYLWEQGLWNAFCDVLSYDAIKYIMADGSFFHGIHENPGVSGTMIIWVKMLQMSQFLKGIKGGMQNITDRMLERVKNKGVAVYTGHCLQSLSPAGEGRVTLAFNTGEFTARHVILAMPSRPLKAIRGLPEGIRPLLDTVIEYPLTKCFFVVKKPWWDEDIPNKGVEAFPARELHYYRKGTKGMVMLYADRPSMSFWSRYVNAGRHDRAEIGGGKRLPLAFAERMDISPENILAFGIRDWAREPYGAGVHLWKAGVQGWKVSEQLAAFSLDDGSPRNAHICGEAFSDYQGFMEGAVRSAQNVLARVSD
ncbi:MAG: FAD-dependent oxidoreductase [Chloroflexi bacterium]|nr:FAD-dependent oxidoreductase [Chloroflexota bacterium]